MASWTDLSAAFGYGTKLTSQQMQQLRDNITALAEGASGAPEIERAALEANIINQSLVDVNAVDPVNFRPQIINLATDPAKENIRYLNVWQAVGWFKLRTPTDTPMTDIRFYARMKTVIPGGGDHAQARLAINGNYSDVASCNDNSFQWVNVDFDVSAAGLSAATSYEAEVQHRGGGSVNTYLQGWRVAWI
jgi:hypothetical protein